MGVRYQPISFGGKEMKRETRKGEKSEEANVT
jgi:hypothetical protein